MGEERELSKDEAVAARIAQDQWGRMEDGDKVVVGFGAIPRWAYDELRDEIRSRSSDRTHALVLIRLAEREKRARDGYMTEDYGCMTDSPVKEMLKRGIADGDREAVGQVIDLLTGRYGGDFEHCFALANHLTGISESEWELLQLPRHRVI